MEKPQTTEPAGTDSRGADPNDGTKVTRRSFGKAIAGGIGALIVASLWGLREWYHRRLNPIRVIAQTNEIPVRGSKIFQYPTDIAPCILVRTTETEYVAYSRLCTHNSCPVFWRPEDNAFACPCHGGMFSITNGAVLQGPPPRPLPRVLLEIRGDDILAVGMSNT
ncbi:MAG TPA: Rieske (2Fe-2S) protein [Candidatus Acidoferrum sp.]|nr:Rieske (2Fe-2S) protein [Candidatus Acidoferrum sp.]